MRGVLGDMAVDQKFSLTADHRRWAKSAKRKYGQPMAHWLELIESQQGRCVFSEAPLLFDSASGTAQKNGHGVHPLYAAVDHCAPGCDTLGHQLVSYDLNDLKGHLPPACFKDLCATPSWKRLMQRWREQAERDPSDRDALRSIRREGHT